MDLQLRDRAAIVGGASQGIGFGIARRLALEGARVAMLARREPSLLEAAERIRAETGASVVPVVADIRKAEHIRRAVEEAVKVFGTIHIVVNNDGAPPVGRLAGFDDAAWQRAVEQNLMSVVRMVREVTPHMRAAGGGSVVNITALSSIQPMIGFGLSVATWAGVIGLAKTLSLELAKDRITINTICPGLIDTPRLSTVFTRRAEQEDRDPSVVVEEVKQSVPIGRLGTPEDIAALVALLVSPLGSFITGTTIQVDGGGRQSLL
ncbi:MAG: SDR family oxidoreductase [Candidatus Rokubacteria bacterium]|nr:SDR family oxidoreductase [Candidatus Rokubacteria bacterium]